MMQNFRSRRWQNLVVLISFVLGGLFFLEKNFHFLRTREIAIQPQEHFTEEIFWNSLDSEKIRYWPLLFLEKNKITHEIEKIIPVQVDLNLSGFGRFRLGIYPLKPLYVIEWKEILWYVDRMGKTWKVSREVNNLIDGISKPDGPVFEVGEGFPIPLPVGVLENSEDLIYQSHLPLDLIRRWNEDVVGLPWFPILERLVMEKRAGEYYLVLQLKSQKGRIDLLLRAESEKWTEITEALGKIMPGFPQHYCNIYIDATYKDKIVVKDVDSWIN